MPRIDEDDDYQRTALISSVAAYFNTSHDNIRTAADHGPLYPPWVTLRDKFYRSNPGWTVREWEQSRQAVGKTDLEEMKQYLAPEIRYERRWKTVVVIVAVAVIAFTAWACFCLAYSSP